MQKYKMIDTHMHIVSGIDDGAPSLDMSLSMLRMAYAEGIKSIFCTSHNWHDVDSLHAYYNNFARLQAAAETLYSDIALYTGNEVFCVKEQINDVLRGLEKGVYLPMNQSHFVLAEYEPYSDAQEVLYTTGELLKNGWTPIIAHVERYGELFRGDVVERLTEAGCLLQVNAYSLGNEKNNNIKARARSLIDKRLITFLGSDAHRINHRPPSVSGGLYYIYDKVDAAYADAVCFGNAERYLIRSHIAPQKQDDNLLLYYKDANTAVIAIARSRSNSMPIVTQKCRSRPYGRLTCSTAADIRSTRMTSEPFCTINNPRRK